MKETLTVDERRRLMAHMAALEEQTLSPEERAEEALWQARLKAKEREAERLRQRTVRAAYREAVWGFAD